MHSKVIAMKHFFIVSVLLLAGCSSQQSYATKLNLPALQTPAVLAPANAGAFEPVLLSIQNAPSPAQIDLVTSSLHQGDTLLDTGEDGSRSGDTPETTKKRVAWKVESDLLIAYTDQAAMIKKAQLEAGDTKDATGEVAQRLNHARQAFANVSVIWDSIPKSQKLSDR